MQDNQARSLYIISIVTHQSIFGLARKNSARTGTTGGGGGSVTKVKKGRPNLPRGGPGMLELQNMLNIIKAFSEKLR